TALSDIASRSGNVSADRARAALSSMFAWAIAEGLCPDGYANPVRSTNTYAGNIDRDRVLSDNEIVAIWNALPEGTDYGRIVKLLFLTGCGPDEIGGLRWSGIKKDERLISFPKERIKNKHEFDLPLSDAAIEILAAVPKRDGRDFVFGQGQSGYQAWSPSKEVLESKLKFEKPWQLRDVRRTIATGMAELGVEPHVVEALLNHVGGHKRGGARLY